MSTSPTISLHPKLAAAFDAVAGALLCWWLTQMSGWWLLALWWIFRLFIWFIIIRLVYYAPGLRRRDHFLSLLLFGLGMASILVFVEWRWSWWWGSFIFVGGSALSFYLLPVKAATLSFVYKIERRWQLALSTVGIAGIWSGIGGVITFNITPWWWAWIMAGAILSALVAWWWWWRYQVSHKNRLVIWSAVFVALMLEVGAVVVWWPIKFLVSGAFIALAWYTLWLVGRFALSEEGLAWKRQLPFFATAFVAAAAVLLFLVKWR